MFSGESRGRKDYPSKIEIQQLFEIIVLDEAPGTVKRAKSQKFTPEMFFDLHN